MKKYTSSSHMTSSADIWSIYTDPYVCIRKTQKRKGKRKNPKGNTRSRVLCENNLLLLLPLTLSSRRVKESKTENQKYLTVVTDSQREKEKRESTDLFGG
jgi:hypothetical protein